jgi:hypothetical protein
VLDLSGNAKPAVQCTPWGLSQAAPLEARPKLEPDERPQQPARWQQQAQQQGGPLSEEEDLLQRIKHVPRRTRTGIVPRHLRSQQQPQQLGRGSPPRGPDLAAAAAAAGLSYPMRQRYPVQYPGLPYPAALWPSALEAPALPSGARALGPFPHPAAAFLQPGGLELAVDVAPPLRRKDRRQAPTAQSLHDAAGASSDYGEGEGAAGGGVGAAGKLQRSSSRAAVGRRGRRRQQQEEEQEEEEEEEEEGSQVPASPQGIDALLQAAELFSRLEGE